jgi:starvation-inducible DNA-binding protein
MPVNQETVKEISRENEQGNPVVQHLQRQLANAFVLYANYKHYHWFTYGPLFRDLHKLFDNLAEEVLETSDQFAERIRMIGQDPITGLRRYQDTATVQSASGRDMREMVEEADANLMGVIRDMREGYRIAEQQNDPGTADLFTKIVQIHEKHEWFLRQILKKRDGLTT